VKTQVRASGWMVTAFRCRFLLEDIVLEASICVCMLWLLIGSHVHDHHFTLGGGGVALHL
jgi:hypothetical protein